MYGQYKDYREVINLCNEAVEVSDRLMRGSFEDIRDGPVQFPLNTEWSIIYDRQIQTILGFMSLTRHLVSRQDGATQVTPLCPVLFMLYIQVEMSFGGWRNRKNRFSWFITLMRVIIGMLSVVKFYFWHIV